MNKEKNAIDEAFINELNGTTTNKKIRLPLPGKASSSTVWSSRESRKRDEGALGHAVAHWNKKNNGLL